MIAAFIRWLRDARMRHYHRKAHAAGTATLAAQIDRDWAAAGRHMRSMHAAQAKRDALLQRRERHYSTDPALLAQCVDQMSASQYVAHHTSGDFRRA